MCILREAGMKIEADTALSIPFVNDRFLAHGSRFRRKLSKLSIRLVGLLLLATVFVAGVKLRHWVWDVTTPLRFVADIRRGCGWGLLSSGHEGLLNQYEKMSVEERD